jgi:hypothetical protein
LVAAHQAAGGVQQGQFTVAAALLEGPLQLERRGGTALVAGAPPLVFKSQPGVGAPGLVCWH